MLADATTVPKQVVHPATDQESCSDRGLKAFEWPDEELSVYLGSCTREIHTGEDTSCFQLCNYLVDTSAYATAKVWCTMASLPNMTAAGCAVLEWLILTMTMAVQSARHQPQARALDKLREHLGSLESKEA